MFHPFEYYEYKEKAILILGYVELTSSILEKAHIYLKNIQSIQLTDKTISIETRNQSAYIFDEFKKSNLSDAKNS